MNHLSDAEWAVMEILWERNSCTLGEISDVLADSMGWRQNTVYTYLTRMEKKGLVTIDKSCSPHRYSFTVSRETCAREERSSLLHKVYKGSAGDLITAFLKESRISEEKRRKLRKLLDDMDV